MRIILIMGTVAVIAAILAGCTAQGPGTPAQPVVTSAPVVPADPAMVSDSPIGKILTDGNGMTLYFFANDAAGDMTSACNGECSALWPAFFEGTVTPSPQLDTTKFSSFTRSDGSHQTTYYGRPLYYYSGDTARGMTLGNGYDNLWFAAGVSGTLPAMTTIPTTVPTPEHPFHPLSSTGGGSY